MEAEIKKQFIEMKAQIEEIHAALFAGEVTLNRKPGTLAIKLAARKMFEETRRASAPKRPLRLAKEAKNGRG